MVSYRMGHLRGQNEDDVSRHLLSMTDVSEDSEALAIIESMRPSSDLARRLGPGGNIRELGSTGDVLQRDGLLFAHDEVRDLLRKTRKLLVSLLSPFVTDRLGSRHFTPPYLVGRTIRYPFVKSALALATLSRSCCTVVSRHAQYGGRRALGKGQDAAVNGSRSSTFRMFVDRTHANL